MRVRILLAVAVTVMVALVTGGGTAAAQEEGGEPNFADHATEECAHLLEEGGDIDECQEAPNPILPETDEILWGAISFVLLFGLLVKFAWPALKKGMEGRTERIRSDLEAAESAKTEAEQTLSDYQAQLADARNESARIIEEARQTADSMKRDLQSRAESDVAQMRQKAADDIESAKVQAVADLQADVAALAIGAAEQVVERALDRETNEALVENYINQVGAGRGTDGAS